MHLKGLMERSWQAGYVTGKMYPTGDFEAWWEESGRALYNAHGIESGPDTEEEAEDVGVDEATVLARLAEELYAFRYAPVLGTAKLQESSMEFRRKQYQDLPVEGGGVWLAHAHEMMARILRDDTEEPKA